MADRSQLSALLRLLAALIAPWAIAAGWVVGGPSGASLAAVLCGGAALALYAFSVPPAPAPAPTLDRVLAHLPDRAGATLTSGSPAPRPDTPATPATLAEALGAPLADDELAGLLSDAPARS